MGNVRSSRTRLGGRMVAGVFIGILTAGFVGATFVTLDKTFENRRLAPWPSFGANSLLSTSFPAKLTKALRDRHLFREQAVVMRNRIKYALFGVRSKGITNGADGWLFLQGPAFVACRERRSPGRIAKEIKRYLDKLPPGLEKSVVFFPNKDFLYADKILHHESSSIHSCSTTRYVRDMNAGSEELGAQFIDLRADLLEKARSSADPIFFKQDTHWKFETSAWAAGRIVDVLRPGIWRPGNVRVIGEKTRIQDISRIVGIPLEMRALHQLSVRRGVVQTKRDFSKKFSRRQPVRTFWHRSKSPASKMIKGHTVLVYDSFMIPAFSVFSPYFEKITWVFWDDFEQPEVQKMIGKADRVILASIYRAVHRRVTKMARLSK